MEVSSILRTGPWPLSPNGHPCPSLVSSTKSRGGDQVDDPAQDERRRNVKSAAGTIVMHMMRLISLITLFSSLLLFFLH